MRRGVQGPAYWAPLFLGPLLLSACSGGDRGPDGTEWQAQIDTIGDTVVVRTLSGSAWGQAGLVPELRIGAVDGAEHEILGDVAGLAVDEEGRIYAYDRQVPALRRYGPDGTYLGTLGRQGGGPGEYQNSDGGLLVLADGRVILRDPGNGRFTVWGPDGEYRESWTARGGMFTSTPIFPLREGGFANPVFEPGVSSSIVLHAPDGSPGDTLPVPNRGVAPPQLTAQREQSFQVWNLPFAPTAVWTLHPEGHFVSAVSDRYALDLLRRDGIVLRIARPAEPVAVSREERAAEEARVIRGMRNLDPSWRWDGPPIPTTKPILRALFAGEDGRIWAQLHQPGERLPDEDSEPGPDGRPPPPQFQEPVVFDVFEEDGCYLGRVSAPEGFSTFPRPVFRGEHVWATARDELGVQSLVRYRIEGPRGDCEFALAASSSGQVGTTDLILTHAGPPRRIEAPATARGLIAP